jgi:hypothetical protein
MLLMIGAAILLASGLVSGHRADIRLRGLGIGLPTDLCAWLGLAAGAATAWGLPW